MPDSHEIAQRRLRRKGAVVRTIQTDDGLKVTTTAEYSADVAQSSTITKPIRRQVVPLVVSPPVAAPAASNGSSTVPAFSPLPEIKHGELQNTLSVRLEGRCHTMSYESTHDAPQLVGLDTQQKEVDDFMQGVLDRGESTSMLLVGASGTGKTTAIVSALQKLKARAATDTSTTFKVVWLDGGLITDDVAALKEISRQLAVDWRDFDHVTPSNATPASSSAPFTTAKASVELQDATPHTKQATAETSTHSGHKRKRMEDTPSIQQLTGGALNISGVEDIHATQADVSTINHTETAADISDNTPAVDDRAAETDLTDKLASSTMSALAHRAGPMWNSVIAYAKNAHKNSIVATHGVEKTAERVIKQMERFTRPRSALEKESKADDITMNGEDEAVEDEEDEHFRMLKINTRHINKNAHVNHLHFLSSALKDSTGASIPTILVITHFDVFAHRSKQTLLYSLLDYTQSKDAHIALCGTSVRLDVVELLEKRLKSRFSHRLLYFPRPNFSQSLEIAKSLMLPPPDIQEQHPGFVAAWNKAVESTLMHPRFGFGGLWRRGVQLRVIFRLLLRCVQRLNKKQQLPHAALLDAAEDIGSASGRIDNGSVMREKLLVQLSSVELCLLAVMAHIENRFVVDGEKVSQSADTIDMSAHAKEVGVQYNFQMVYHELYSDLTDTNSTVLSRGLDAKGIDATKSELAAYLPNADVALCAFERLIDCGLVRLTGRAAVKAGVGRSLPTEHLSGACSYGPDLAIWMPHLRTSDRHALPYLPCKMAIDADTLLRVVNEEAAKSTRVIDLTTQLAQWVINGGKKAPIF